MYFVLCHTYQISVPCLSNKCLLLGNAATVDKFPRPKQLSNKAAGCAGEEAQAVESGFSSGSAVAPAPAADGPASTFNFTTDPGEPFDGDDSPRTAAIAGGIAAGVVGLAAIVLAAVVLMRRRALRKADADKAAADKMKYNGGNQSKGASKEEPSKDPSKYPTIGQPSKEPPTKEAPPSKEELPSKTVLQYPPKSPTNM